MFFMKQAKIEGSCHIAHTDWTLNIQRFDQVKEGLKTVLNGKQT